MTKDVLKRLLAVPTDSYKEQIIVEWLVYYIKHNIPGATVVVDKWRNIYVTKGCAAVSPCVAAHIDSVHAIQPINIVEDGGRLIGFSDKNERIGIGGDDKAGVFVCLSLLHRFANIRAVFFATEECGMIGARNADPLFFNGVGYVMEFDCPSRNMMSYTSSGVRLFANDGDFIKSAYPSLMAHGTKLWQNHPYTDVMTIRKRFPISCLNLSCGYYNWHMRDEFVLWSDVELAVAQGADLVRTIEYVRHTFPVGAEDLSESLHPITALEVPEAEPQSR